MFQDEAIIQTTPCTPPHHSLLHAHSHADQHTVLLGALPGEDSPPVTWLLATRSSLSTREDRHVDAQEYRICEIRVHLVWVGRSHCGKMGCCPKSQGRQTATAPHAKALKEGRGDSWDYKQLNQNGEYRISREDWESQWGPDQGEVPEPCMPRCSGPFGGH